MVIEGTRSGRMLLTHNQCSTISADRDTPNTIVTYNFWREHRLIMANPNRPRHLLGKVRHNKPGTVVSPKRYVNSSLPALLNFHDLNEIMKRLIPTSLM